MNRVEPEEVYKKLDNGYFIVYYNGKAILSIPRMRNGKAAKDGIAFDTWEEALEEYERLKNDRSDS